MLLAGNTRKIVAVGHAFEKTLVAHPLPGQGFGEFQRVLSPFRESSGVRSSCGLLSQERHRWRVGVVVLHFAFGRFSAFARFATNSESSPS